MGKDQLSCANIENLVSPWDLIACYESPKQEKVSHAFEHLVQNLKVYNGIKI